MRVLGGPRTYPSKFAGTREVLFDGLTLDRRGLIVGSLSDRLRQSRSSRRFAAQAVLIRGCLCGPSHPHLVVTLPPGLRSSARRAVATLASARASLSLALHDTCGWAVAVEQAFTESLRSCLLRCYRCGTAW